MKRQILWAAFLGAITSSLFAQGTILFSTRIVGQVDAPVRVGHCAWGLYPNMKAQLFLVTGSGARTALTPATTFYEQGTNQWPRSSPANYVVPPDEPVIVPTVLPGQQATIVMRAFQGESYETARLYAESNPITITLGGRLPDGTELPPAVLTGLQGFQTTGGPSVITSIEVKDNQLEIGICVNFGYVLYSSSDLKNWQPILTNSSPTVRMSLTNSVQSQFFRFYH